MKSVRSETITDMIHNTMKEKKGVLIVMVGLPGSGKSTIAKSFTEEFDCTIVSDDDANIFNNKIKELLKENKMVVADATNLTMKSRRGILDPIQNIDCLKIAFIVSKDFDICVHDNHQRENNVPFDTMDKMLKSFQIPFNEEGFDIVHIHRTEYTPYPNKYTDTCTMFSRAVSDCEDYNQNNPNHSHTLDKHQDLVTKEFNDWMQNRDDFSVNDKMQYSIAAKYHDIGKPYCKIEKEDGTWGFNNHANVGAYFALTAGVLFDLDQIFLINYHMLPFNWNDSSTCTKYKKIFGDKKYTLLVNFNNIDKKCC